MGSLWKAFPTADAASAACAAHILQSLSAALTARGKGTLAVSGGSTPKLLFGHLARAGFDWSRTHIFFVDERCVPPEHADSNYRLCREHLLDAAGVPAANVHRMLGELEPAAAAQKYDAELAQVLGPSPVFDIIHRGMGADAHTASLFPGEALIDDRARHTAAVYVEKLKAHRITLMPAVLLAARETLVLAAGADKAAPLQTVFHGPRDTRTYPSQLDTPWASWVTWYLDEAAAAGLAP